MGSGLNLALGSTSDVTIEENHLSSLGASGYAIKTTLQHADNNVTIHHNTLSGFIELPGDLNFSELAIYRAGGVNARSFAWLTGEATRASGRPPRQEPRA